MNINWGLFRKSIIFIWIISLCTVSYLSVVPQVDMPFDFKWFDKVCHFLAYFWVSVLPFFGFSRVKKAMICALLMIPLGMGLEFVQGFVPGRFLSAGDMIVNGFGVTVGIVLGRSLLEDRSQRWYRRR